MQEEGPPNYLLFNIRGVLTYVMATPYYYSFNITNPHVK